MNLIKMPRSIKRRQKHGMTSTLEEKSLSSKKKVLLFNSRLKLFLGKLKSRW